MSVSCFRKEDRDRVSDALAAAGSIAGAARALGVNRNTLQAYTKHEGIKTPVWKRSPFEFNRGEVVDALADQGSITGAAQQLRVSRECLRGYIKREGIEAPVWRRKPDPPRLGDPADESPSNDELEHQYLEYLRAKGYLLSQNTAIDNRRFVREPKCFEGNTFRVGVISDTHLCSRYQQLTALHAAYDYFVEHEVDTVLHAGDFGAGNGRMYRGQSYELHTLGADAQRRYMLANYPQRDGVTTMVISGNHDHSHIKSAGQNLVEAVCEAREDLVYLGMSGAFVDLHGVPFYLMHPTGGLSYARSYRLQKLIEQMAPENKPKVFICGHYHVTCELPMYRNVYGWMAGCFESQTPFELEKGLYPEVGFSILEVVANKSDLVSVKKEWVPFFESVPEDY